MKRRALSILLAMCLLLSVLATMMACDGGTTDPEPEKLEAPSVTLDGNTARWQANEKADKFEISLDGNLFYMENTVTSKTLEDGQTIKIRAVGDGVTTLTSDWSNAVTYNKPAQTTTPIETETTESDTDAPATTEDPDGETTEAPADDTTVAPDGETTEASAGDTTEAPVGETTEAPDGETTEAPDGETTEAPDGETTEAPDGETTEAPDGETTEAPDGETTEAPATETTEAPATETSEAPTSETTETGTEAPENTEGATAAPPTEDTNEPAPQPPVQPEDTNAPAPQPPVQPEDTNAPAPQPPVEAGDAPQYLGIFASNLRPAREDGLPEGLARPISLLSSRRLMSARSSRSFAEALAEYFTNRENHLGTSVPSVSDYDVYSSAGETVYVQIWLNNPDQYTILSLMLNGVKYQVGGDLFSFFIEEGGVHYNCVYVAVTIPQNTYVEKTYTVTNIEYIQGTYINPDGTDEFMNENDTVTVGLPYSAQTPSVSNVNVHSTTHNSFSMTLDLSDETLAGLCEGWLGVAVYDGNDIVLNKAIAAGENRVDATSLEEDTYYIVVVYLYGDLHDGNGVKMHTLMMCEVMTESVIDEFVVDPGYYVVGGIEGIEEPDSGLSIDVSVWFKSDTAELDRIELYLGDELVYSDNDAYSFTVIRELLAKTTYLVKIYYSDEEYSEHCAEAYVTTNSLVKPSMEMQNKYTFINAAAFTFEALEGTFNGVALTKNVKVRFYKDILELRYADFILRLCDDPEALDDAQARFDAAIEAGDYNLASKIDHEELTYLRMAKECMEYGDYSSNGYDRQAWEAFFASCSATYTLDDEDMFIHNGTAYVIVRDYFELFGEDDVSYEICADVDYKDGRGFVNAVLEDGSLWTLYPINSTDNRVEFDIDVDGLTARIEPQSRVDGKYGKLAIVSYTVELLKDGNTVKVLYTYPAVVWDEMVETAWVNKFVAAMKGEAILPDSEQEMIDELGWLAIFEIVNGLDIEAEEDYEDGDGGSGDVVVEGNGGVIVGGGRGEQIIGNLAERELLRALLICEYPEDYEYDFREQMLEAFMQDENYYSLTEGLDTVEEKLEALIGGALNSTIVRVFGDCAGSIYHYLYWTGSENDDIYTDFKACIEQYMSANSIESSVDWTEAYRRRLASFDFEYFYPHGTYEVLELVIDTEGLAPGKYELIVKYNRGGDDYDHVTYAGQRISVSGKLPTPEITINEGRYIGDPRVEAENFWDYYFELELYNAANGLIYSGKLDDYDRWGNPLLIGQKIRIRAVINDWVTDSIYSDSDWAEYVFEGVKLETPYLNGYSLENFTISFNGVGGAAYYVYTINGGDEIRLNDGESFDVVLDNGDVFRVKAVAAEGGEYIDSDWAEYTCTDTRPAIPTPVPSITESEITWSAVDGASYYVVECKSGSFAYTNECYETTYYGVQVGVSYRVRAVSSDTVSYKSSAWSEYVVFSVKLVDPEFTGLSGRNNNQRVNWSSVEYASSYNYKIGENGEVQSQSGRSILVSSIPVGEKLYVQAIADGCESSEWVMIYHNVTALATPTVTVSGGVASWDSIDGAEGYLYKINDGTEQFTTGLSVSGLTAGDTITVCAKTEAFGYGNSAWSEVKTQLAILKAPVLNDSSFNSQGTLSWEAVDGATSYEYEVDGGSPNAIWDVQIYDIQYGSSVRVRAICDNGEYELYGEWSELVTRQDTRIKLDAPAAMFDSSQGLMVLDNDDRVATHQVRYEGNETIFNYGAEHTGDYRCLMSTVPSMIAYVRSVPSDTSLYAESDWTTVEISFE